MGKENMDIKTAFTGQADPSGVASEFIQAGGSGSKEAGQVD